MNNNKITVKGAFNSGKCKKILNLVKKNFQLLPRPPTRTLPLDATGGLPSTRPPISAFPHWFTAQIPPWYYKQTHMSVSR